MARWERICLPCSRSGVQSLTLKINTSLGVGNRTSQSRSLTPSRAKFPPTVLPSLVSTHLIYPCHGCIPVRKRRARTDSRGSSQLPMGQTGFSPNLTNYTVASTLLVSYTLQNCPGKQEVWIINCHLPSIRSHL